jgi:hypothetical protein
MQRGVETKHRHLSSDETKSQTLQDPNMELVLTHGKLVKRFLDTRYIVSISLSTFFFIKDFPTNWELECLSLGGRSGRLLPHAERLHPLTNLTKQGSIVLTHCVVGKCNTSIIDCELQYCAGSLGLICVDGWDWPRLSIRFSQYSSKAASVPRKVLVLAASKT